MSMRGTSRARRAAATVALAAALALTAAGCGSGGDDVDGGAKSSDTSETSGGGDSDAKGEGQQDAGDEEVPSEPIAEVKNKEGIVLRILELKRDGGGFVTLNGELENTGTEDFLHIQDWSGREQGADKSSLMGATFVDSEGKKRYYALRDTEMRCLCTSGIASLDAGETLTVYIQFPAPPDETTEVEFQLPTFPPSNLEISE
ncbi:hypothetical protein AA958_22540 [Streptomyces sp. CNQ-509]|uniref:hypothetical protein n=1 Tax=Streptomyces sp. CNQ-509 TaxID=444103 RepID=UPI00062DFF87|nr:hypothetical protein [Streptomyces sp. CNQ-509]AKH84515.1 hypothetical protein AA958_22540 [Streptomyces sp. CNQ-509]